MFYKSTARWCSGCGPEDKISGPGGDEHGGHGNP